MQNPASMGDGRAAVKVSLGVAVVGVLALGLTFVHLEKLSIMSGEDDQDC